MARKYRRGEVVVYTRQKASKSPGPRAHDISPATAGDTYTYLVDKYWIVADLLEGGRLRLLTRSGKEHQISTDDLRLRHLSLWERFFMRHKFPPTSLLDAPAAQDS